MLNTHVLDNETEKDGKKMILFDYKLGEEVATLFNKLDIENLPTKVEALKQILAMQDDSFRKWLAQYMVMKLISIKISSHSLYNCLLLDLEDKNLDDYVKNETVRNIKLLLNNDCDHTSSNERELLKNFGHWFGIITISRNRPILFEDLDILSLMVESFNKSPQEVCYILPFIINVIMSSPKSKIFTPTSAWMQQILNTVAQIHRAFDSAPRKNMETIICNELSDGSLSTFQKIFRLTKELSEIQTPEVKSTSHAIYSHQAAVDNETVRNVEKFQRESSLSPIMPSYSYADINIRESIESQLKMPDSCQLFRMFPTLNQQCRIAIAKTVMGYLNVIVQRLITYSLPTTSELIKNDFGRCSDANQFQAAAHHLMRSVTCALAMTLIKEPLSSAILDSTRHAFHLQLHSYTSLEDGFPHVVHQTMKEVMKRNMEFSWCYVTKTACEKGIIEIHKRLKELFEHQQRGTIHQISPEVQSIISKLPPEFRPRDRQMNDEEMKVYSAFQNHLPGFKPPEDVALVNDPSPPDVTTIAPQLVHEMIRPDTNSIAKKIFVEWIEQCTKNTADDLLISYYFSALTNHDIHFSQENILKQLKAYLELCSNFCYRHLSDLQVNIRRRCYTVIDSFSKLVCLLVKNAENIKNTNRMQMVHRCLDLLTTSLITDHDSRSRDFNGLPFLRVFITIIKDLCHHEHDSGSSSRLSNIEALGHALQYIQPQRVPGFAFHWLEIIGHRVFITELLGDKSRLCRSVFTELILGLLKFLSPNLQNNDITKAVHTLYLGTLRIMLLILHDFPEVLCEYYYVLCDVIPTNCVQLRNLILSAYPSNMRLPDPFAHHFSLVESLPDMAVIPKIPFEMFNSIPEAFREQIDSYYTTNMGVNFLMNLSVRLRTSSLPDSRYNVPLLNAFVNYVGFRAITHLKESNIRISISNIAHSPHFDVFESLALSLCPEGRYLLFNAFCNQLRYPNALTHYFSCLVLYLFKESSNDIIREQITHNFFERMISLRPHPWGMLLTFFELLRNDDYKFWSCSFIHTVPLIKRLLVNVATSFNLPLPPDISSNDFQESQKSEVDF